MTYDFGKLSAPFPVEEIEWRVGNTNSDKTMGMALGYLTSRHVMDRLDDVVGPANWQASYEETSSGRVLATISINIDGQWVAKSDGAGSTDIEGDKGGISSALKRAAVLWGIGRYLYGLSDFNTWVPLKPRGRTQVIDETPETLGKLHAALHGAAKGEVGEKVVEKSAYQAKKDAKEGKVKGWEDIIAEMRKCDTLSAVAQCVRDNKDHMSGWKDAWQSAFVEAIDMQREAIIDEMYAAAENEDQINDVTLKLEQSKLVPKAYKEIDGMLAKLAVKHGIRVAHG